jgi:hypothetical protein
MQRFAFRTWLQAATVFLATGMILVTTPAAAIPPTTGVDALARLSAADLDTARPAGRAFLKSLFPNPACGKPDTEHLPFDRLCNWASDPNSDDVFPDLMVAMNKGRIVSVVTVEHERLNPGIWTCEKAAEGQAALCFAKTIDAATQRLWSQAWHAYLSSVS